LCLPINSITRLKSSLSDRKSLNGITSIGDEHSLTGFVRIRASPATFKGAKKPLSIADTGEVKCSTAFSEAR
jgi:hypothetical protein